MYTMLLLANTIFETIIGVAMIFFGQYVLRTQDSLTLAVARIFGVAVISIAAMSFVLLVFLRRNKGALLGGFVTLSIFHFGMAMVQAYNFTQGHANFADPIVHAIFAFLFIASLVKEIHTGDMIYKP